MKASDIVSWTLMVISTCCAIAVTAVLVQNRSRAKASVDGGSPVFVEEWKAYALEGRRIGPSEAAVTIVEFGDYECPVCRRFANGALAGVLAEHPGQIALVFRHWPLSYHRLAYPAARAAECAAEQGHFAPFHDLLYQKGDSLGLKSFDSYAHESGVPDSVRFAECVMSSDPVERIEADILAAEELGATGTPFLLVNSRRLLGAPDSTRFARLVREALDESR